MKTVKITLGIIIMLAFFGLNEVAGQWAPDGINIHNTNAGNVAIGVFPATTLLQVGKIMVEPTIKVQNFGGAGGATFQMTDIASGADWKFKATALGGFKIRDNAFAMDVIVVEPNSAVNSIYINNLGDVGLGSAAPLEKLHVEGGDFRLSDYYPFIFFNNTQVGGNMGLTFRQNDAYRAWLYYDDGESLLRLNAEAGGGGRNDLVILSSGSVCLGTTTAAAGYRLSVNGKVACTEVLVETLANWPDYVFGEGYKLMDLNELENSIKKNNHLPGLPSASEVQEHGFQLADMQRRLVEKVEEMTLYIIEQNKQMTELQKKVETLEKDNLKKTRRQK